MNSDEEVKDVSVASISSSHSVALSVHNFLDEQEKELKPVNS